MHVITKRAYARPRPSITPSQPSQLNKRRKRIHCWEWEVVGPWRAAAWDGRRLSRWHGSIWRRAGCTPWPCCSARAAWTLRVDSHLQEKRGENAGLNIAQVVVEVVVIEGAPVNPQVTGSNQDQVAAADSMCVFKPTYRNAIGFLVVPQRSNNKEIYCINDYSNFLKPSM